MGDRYEIIGTQQFTDSGTFGAWLFVLSPFATGGGYAWLLNEIGSYSPNVIGPALVLLFSGLAFFGGCVMMLVGRRQHFQVRTFASETREPMGPTTDAPWPAPLGKRLDHKW